MKKEILLSGLLGGIVIFAWLVISHGPLPLSGDLPKPIPNDKNIHTALREKIVASERILARFSRRVVFVTAVGLFLAVCGDTFSEKPVGLIILSSLQS